MKKTPGVRTFLVLLALGLAPAAWAGQDLSATSVSGLHADVPAGATAKPARTAGAATKPLPSIVDEDEIPAYLRMDPCDTGDS